MTYESVLLKNLNAAFPAHLPEAAHGSIPALITEAADPNEMIQK